MAEKLEIIVTAQDQASKVLGGIRGALGGIAQVAGGIITSQIITNLGRQFVQFGKDVVSEVGEAQDMQAQLNAVLKSTGGIAGVTSSMVNNLADSLSKVTKFEDETIISAENMLLTFTNISKDVFPDTTKVLLDMSTAMNQDLKTSAIQVGKALNNPVEGLSALTRVGVKFTKEQERMIKSLVAQGKVTEAQKIILQELQKEFGGSAVAAGATFAGSIEILTNKFSNFKEEIGMAVLPLMTRLIDHFGEFADRLMPRVIEFVENNLVPGFQKLGDTISGLLTGETSLTDLIPPDVLEKISPITDAFNGLKDTVMEDMPMIEEKVQETLDNIKKTFEDTSPQLTEDLSNTITKMEEIWNNHGDTITSVISKAFEGAGVVLADALLVALTSIEVAATWAQMLLDAFSEALKGNWWKVAEIIATGLSETWTAVLENFQVFFDNAGALVGTNLETFKTTWQTNWDNLKLIVSTVFEDIKTSIKDQVSKFVQLGKDIINGIKDGVKAAAVGLVNEVVGAVKQSLAAANAALGVNSPSKEFMKLGYSVVEGFEKGSRGLGNNILPMLDGMFDKLQMSGFSFEPSKSNPVNQNSEQNFYAPIYNNLQSGTSVLQQLSALT